jgi:hypothetical protein
MSYQGIYPDVYYKVQPFVMMACDEMDAYGSGLPTRSMVRQISDQIHSDVARVHPDLTEQSIPHGMSYEMASAYGVPGSMVEAQQWGGGFFNDLIDILLLNELFRRRRR